MSSRQLLPAPVASLSSTTPAGLSQARTGTLTGAWAMMPEPMPPECRDTAVAEEPGLSPPGPGVPVEAGEQSAPETPSLIPPAVAVVPHRSTGTLTGAWMMFPEAMPPESLLIAVAVEPPLVPGTGTVSQSVGLTVSVIATAEAVVPQARIGASIGTWTVLPEAIPLVWSVTTVAEAPVGEVHTPLPTTSLTAAASTVVPQRFTPRSIGIWTVLPARMPPSLLTFAAATAPPPGFAAERGTGRLLRLGLSGSALRTLRGAERALGLAAWLSATPLVCAGPVELPKPPTAASARGE